MKRVLSIFLLITLAIGAICPALVSCSKKKGEETPVTTPRAESTEYDGLEAVDYGGKEIRFLTYSEGDNISTIDELEGDIAGDPVERGVYERNIAMYDKYNISFTYQNVVSNAAGIVNEVRTQYTAGTNELDYVLAGTMNTTSCGVQGYTLPMQNIPHIQTDKEWWYSDFIDKTAIAGKNYFLMGDFAYTSWTASVCTVFNQDLATEYQISAEEIFDLIRNGKWTVDTFIQYTKLVYTDADRDNEVSLGDTFGFFSNSACVDALLAGSDITFIKEDTQGNLKLGFDERFTNFYDKIYDLAHAKTSVYSDAAESWGAYNRNNFPNLFEQNQVLFQIAGLPYHNTSMREVDFTYLFLPLPKWNEDQDKYYAWCHQYNSSSVAVMNGEKDLDMLGRILEDFAFYSLKYVRPSYYNVLLEGILANSTVFVEMLDYIVGIYSIDRTSLFANEGLTLLNGSTGDLRKLVNYATKANPNSLLRNSSKWQKIIDRIVDNARKQG